jgi:hypothetical protein
VERRPGGVVTGPAWVGWGSGRGLEACPELCREGGTMDWRLCVVASLQCGEAIRGDGAGGPRALVFSLTAGVRSGGFGVGSRQREWRWCVANAGEPLLPSALSTLSSRSCSALPPAASGPLLLLALPWPGVGGRHGLPAAGGEEGGDHGGQGGGLGGAEGTGGEPFSVGFAAWCDPGTGYHPPGRLPGASASS